MPPQMSLRFRHQKKTQMSPAVFRSGEMRTRSQFKGAFSADGANKKRRDGSAEKNPRNPEACFAAKCAPCRNSNSHLPQRALKGNPETFSPKNDRLSGLFGGSTGTRLQLKCAFPQTALRRNPQIFAERKRPNSRLFLVGNEYQAAIQIRIFFIGRQRKCARVSGAFQWRNVCQAAIQIRIFSTGS